MKVLVLASLIPLSIMFWIIVDLVRGMHRMRREVENGHARERINK